MKKNYEAELPQNYKEVFHIDARDKKTGLIMSLVSFIPSLAIIVLLYFTAELNLKEVLNGDLDSLKWVMLFCLVLMVSIIAYTVLHELVHGAVYKALTKQKLKFGMSWSCAFCGVPEIYTYRLTALLALVAPFLVFGIIFLALTIVFAFLHPVYYTLFAILLAVHVGGCCGDLYMTALLLFKYKDKALLMRDTGPEQWIYLPEK